MANTSRTDYAVGHVTDQRDMIGRPIAIGDQVLFKENAGRNTHFTEGTIVQQYLKYNNPQPRFEVKYKKGDTTTRKDTHRILVITQQIKANREDFPEYYI